jgi:hypothetical protein
MNTDSYHGLRTEVRNEEFFMSEVTTSVLQSPSSGANSRVAGLRMCCSYKTRRLISAFIRDIH